MALHHILAHFDQNLDAIWRVIDIAQALQNQQHEVALWSLQTPHPIYREYGINVIRPFQGKVPSGGNLKVIGHFPALGAWWAHVRFAHVSQLNFSYDLHAFGMTIHQLSAEGSRLVTIEYTSTNLAKRYALAGLVTPWPGTIDMIHTLPSRKPSGAQTVIGRFGLDTLDHHDARDIQRYEEWMGLGHTLQLMGSTCLHPFLENNGNIHLMPQPTPVQLLACLEQLDYVYYRPGMGHEWDTPPIGVEIAQRIGIPLIAGQ